MATAASRVVLALVLSVSLGTSAARSRVAFLDRGEVWELNPAGGAPRARTRTGGLVEDFRFSPRGDYLAYAKRLRPGRERPICSIVVIDAASGRILTEITPADGWMDIDKWLGSRLLYHASSGLEVSAVFEFDAARGVGRELPPETGSIAIDSDATPDGTLVAWVDDAGLGPTFAERLHLLDTVTNHDSIETSRRSLMSPAISPARDAVAFVEVLGDGTAARDRVWVYRRADASTTLIDDDVVSPKSAGVNPAWSPDGRFVLTDFAGRVKVLDVAARSRQLEVRGTDACWSDATTIVFATAAGIEAADVVSGDRRLLRSPAVRPQCLPAGTS